MTTSEPQFQSNPLLALFDRVEEKMLCLLLAAMIVLACLQIFLRTAVSGGLLWIDPLLRYLVLWSGLLGAVAASGAKARRRSVSRSSTFSSPALRLQ